MKLKSNLNSVIGKLEALLTNPETFDSIVRTVAIGSLASMQTRIYEDGEKSDSTKIGKYSTTPIYVSVVANPGKSFGRPIGKTGQSKFADGRDHKSRYFKDGYDGFKSAIGRNPGFVNLSLSGQLNSQMSIITTSTGYGIGWIDTEKVDRALALQDKYGKLWSLTQNENEQAKKIAINELIKSIQ